VRTVRTECLDRLLIWNNRHLHRALTAYLAHYNRAVRIEVWASTCRYQCLARGWSADVAA